MLIQREPSWTFNLQFDDQGLTVDALPPKHEVRELAHLLRPFILEGETTFFYKILRVVHERLQHPRLEVMYRAWSRRFNAKDSQEVIRITAGDLLINSDRALNIWLNAYHYHREHEKRELLNQLHEDISFEASEAIFVDQLLGKAAAILLMASLIDQIAAARNRYESTDR